MKVATVGGSFFFLVVFIQAGRFQVCGSISCVVLAVRTDGFCFLIFLLRYIYFFTHTYSHPLFPFLCENFHPDMDPTCLRPDELNFELVLRNIATNQPDRLQQLQLALSAEALGQREVPLDTERIIRQTVTQEVRECDAKLTEISADYDEALGSANDPLLESIQSRLIHLSGRVKRLRVYAQDHAAVIRIACRVNELVESSKAGRLSLGAGESMLEPDMMVEGFDGVYQGAVGGVRKRTPKPKQVTPSPPPPTAAPWANLRDSMPRVDNRFTLGLGEMTSTYEDRRHVSQHRMQSANQSGQGVQGGFRIAKWPLRFSGVASELTIDEFLFRIERLARLDGVSPAALAIGVGVLLTDRAAQWYWTYQRKDEGASWEELKAAFVRRYRPQRENDHDIRAKIEARKQRSGEHFGDFCQDIEALAVRLLRRMPEDEIVETLRRNMTMPLRKALWRTPTASIDELMQVCDEFESLCEEEDRQTRAAQRRQGRVSEIEAVDAEDEWAQSRAAEVEVAHGGERYVDAMQQGMSRSDRVICWNCKDIGHLFSQCQKPLLGRFCFSCGMSNVLKAECPKCAGNARRDVRMAAARSMPHAQPQILKRTPSAEPTQPLQVAAVGNPFSAASDAQAQ